MLLIVLQRMSNSLCAVEVVLIFKNHVSHRACIFFSEW